MSKQDPRNADGSDLPPEKAAAKKRAESIAARREHPEFATSRLQRPQSVVAGCVMAWIGCALLAFGAYTWITADENSTAIDQSASPAEIADAVRGLHFYGWFVLLVAALLLTLSILAFSGRKWAATGMLVMAGVAVLVALVGLLTAFLTWFITAALWSIGSASLVRTREPSKEWYAALAEHRAIKRAG